MSVNAPAAPKAPDLRKLGPAALCRLLNSTPLGPVITERRLGLQRTRAGLRIGEGRHVDLVRYVAWLVTERHAPREPQETAVDPYTRVKEAARERAASIARSGRDIGPLPATADAEARDACRCDFRLFCEWYFPLTFNLAWSEDHLKVIGQIETSVLSGGLFATAMPRGSGKSSMAEVACIWATLYGHRDFVCLIGSDEGHAGQMLDSIKAELEGNEALAADFPEVCGPIARLEGIANRCNGQLCDGERTHITWTASEVILPTIAGSIAAGAIIKVAGLTGGLRGMKFKRPDGRTVRPSLVVLDDPQTDGSARSPSQCQTRERILAGAILGLAGPGKKISGIMPCTVIAPGDMADAILDRDRHPEWNGTRTKMVYAFPTNEKLWEEYGQIRAESLKAEHGGAEATEFYRQNRAAMDEGARVAWPERYEYDEISALQHAMNLKLRDERAFRAEYQNDPLPETNVRPDDLTPDQITCKLNSHPRGIVPVGCDRLTAFIDVQKTLLYYSVVAWEDGFGGNLIGYGSFPDQQRDYFTLRDAKLPIANAVAAPDLEGQLYAALTALTTGMLVREWPREDGAMIKVERCLVDANWGQSTEIIYKFCRMSPFAAILTPSHGKYIGAASSPMREWARKPGERVGPGWRLRSMAGKRAVRSVLIDTNFWKSFVHNRLAVPVGSRSSFLLYGDKPSAHRMLADHLCSEYRVKTAVKSSAREVDEWKQRPERPDNHLFDCLVGSAVAASMLGLALDEATAPRPERPKRVSFADLQRRRQAPPEARA